MIKTADGNPMIGPTAEDIEDKEDLSTTEEGFKKVIALSQRLVPAINESDIIAYFSGLRRLPAMILLSVMKIRFPVLLMLPGFNPRA